ncbi:hypothetical protein NFJ76_22410 (plasmid) [Citrobacter freundii]|uniref:hypothetical protein n=1 Tax=Citrobacter freundii TaxID=546 RepID=UPI0024335D63|nr:hypothetical protein [Citrobacter freundii]WFW62694.1 hypothetical protein NFJ76_22410 [Citrobacter freundii]
MGSCAAPSAKGDDKFITTDYLQQCRHVHPKVLQVLMGHKKFESTEVYTKIFALDVAASQQVRFSLDTQDALQLLRGNR